jgi:hypothetical protein
MSKMFQACVSARKGEPYCATRCAPRRPLRLHPIPGEDKGRFQPLRVWRSLLAVSKVSAFLRALRA